MCSSVGSHFFEVLRQCLVMHILSYWCVCVRCCCLVGAQVFSCLQVLMQSMAEYTRKEYATLVWNLLTVSRGL